MLKFLLAILLVSKLTFASLRYYQGEIFTGANSLQECTANLPSVIESFEKNGLPVVESKCRTMAKAHTITLSFEQHYDKYTEEFTYNVDTELKCKNLVSDFKKNFPLISVDVFCNTYYKPKQFTVQGLYLRSLGQLVDKLLPSPHFEKEAKCLDNLYPFVEKLISKGLKPFLFYCNLTSIDLLKKNLVYTFQIHFVIPMKLHTSNFIGEYTEKLDECELGLSRIAPTNENKLLVLSQFCSKHNDYYYQKVILLLKSFTHQNQNYEFRQIFEENQPCQNHVQEIWVNLEKTTKYKVLHGFCQTQKSTLNGKTSYKFIPKIIFYKL